MPERFLGRTLGKYHVESLIGSGGFAWVFKGFDPELEIPVAIKVLKPQFAGDPTLVDRFRKEASTAAKLRHPNIIKIFTVGKEGDAVYFVMDYLPNGLADKLEATQTLPEDYVLRVGIDVARALGFAHREGVIHRDIKVDNILFDSHGNAVVADFGIARAVTGYTQHTGTNMVVGTPQYFAPEQARAKPLDGRADIYSLGVTLFRSATGRLPFEGDDWYEIARQHVEDPPPAPRTITPSLSAEFEGVLLQCLAKAPEDRPATGDELAEHLDVLRQQHRDPTLARTVTVPAQLANTLVTPALPRPAATPSAAAPPQKARREVVVPSVLAMLALLTVIGWQLLRNWSATPPLSGAPLDTTAQTVTVPPFDSAGTSTSPIDSSRPANDTTAPPKAKLQVTIPTDAQLTVNGAAVPTPNGVWKNESLDSGRYALHAFVTAIDGCPSATIDSTINLRPTFARSIRLSPRPCGTLQLFLRQPDNAVNTRFSVAGIDAPGKREGNLPLRQDVNVMLPAGRWTLSASNPRCVNYGPDTVSIGAGDTLRRALAIICP